MDETLQHHGVKGMKWGVRRTPEQLGHRPTGAERRAARAAKRQARRDSIADQYRKDSRKERQTLDKANQVGIANAQKKLKVAKDSGASARKISRLERKVTDKQIRAHVEKVRERQMAKDTENYMRKSAKEKLADPKFWETMAGKHKNETTSYRNATSKAYDSAKKKYGEQAVNSLNQRDAAKNLALAIGATAIVAYAQTRA